MRSVTVTLVLIALLVTAGCAERLDGRLAPDEVGVENGVAADESIAVTPADGYNETELDRVLARTMARVEAIRGLEFTESVEIEVISRATFRDRRDGVSIPAGRERLLTQVWEAQFVLGENEDLERSLESLYGSGIVGFYAPRDNRIVIVSESATPRIDRTTLAHELVHALQDAHFDRARRTTRDGRTAQTGLREGDANLVAALYERRCGEEWSCLPRPGGNASVDRDAGLYVDVIAPYTDGPSFVATLRERGGWAAVNEAYDDPPRSTEQLFHPTAYPDDRPVSVELSDRSNGAWERVGTDRLGELGAFLTLWSGGGIDRESYYRADGPFSARNYTHPASSGWAGDRFVAYRNGDRGGYVWTIRWETPTDAEQFAAAYRRGLDALGAERVTRGVYRIEAGGFADAFRLTVENRTVRVTNGPSVASLDAIHDSTRPAIHDPARPTIHDSGLTVRERGTFLSDPGEADT